MEKFDQRDSLAGRGAHDTSVATAGLQMPGSYVDWAAIIGGAVIAVALGLLATGFGAALGMGAISAREAEDASTLGLILSAFWIIVSMIAAYAAGGYVAGRMRRKLDSATTHEVTVRDGMNGLIVWALGTILSAMMLATVVSSTISAVGSVAATASQAAGSAIGGIAQGAGAAASMLPASDVNPVDFIGRSLMRSTGSQPAAETPEDTLADATSIIGNVLATGEISDSDRAYLIQTTAARTGLSPAEAEVRVTDALNAATSARDEAAAFAEEAEQTARDVAETARISAILTAFLLTAAALVAGVAAYVCAVWGGRHRDEGRIFGGFSYNR